MTNLFGLLGLGAQGMSANSFGTSVASQNASNVGTEGYSRRTATLEPLAPPSGGVRAVGSRRITDAFLERRMLGSAALLGESSARSQALGAVDSILTEGAGSVGESLDAFWAAFDDISAHPADAAARVVLLQRAGSVAASLGQAAAALQDARSEIESHVAEEVVALDGMLHQIARLGTEISRAELGGQEASDLRDQRDQLVRNVASLVPVSRIDSPDGKMSLLLDGGTSLVSAEGDVSSLTAAADPATGDLHLYKTEAGAQVDVTARLRGGSIAGALAARDQTIAQAQAAFDQIAFDLAGAVNGVHAAGYGLDGATGRNLFEPLAGGAGAAANLRVSADVIGNPDAIAAATDPLAVPGDNRNILALQALQDATFAAGGTATVGDALSRLVATAGSGIAAARSDAEGAQRSSDQLAALRESVSGVSMDEEMIALTRYQRGYQASLRVVQMADEMLAELLELGR